MLKYSKYGSANGMYGKKHSLESREKMSKSIKNYYKSNSSYRRGETFEELFGSSKSRELKENLSKFASIRTGSKNPFYGKTHSEETKKILSDSKKGNIPANARKVIIDSVEYSSVTEASRVLGVVAATIIHRIKSKNPKYNDYFYKDEL